MTAVRDETLCGPLCQHPSCWETQRRVIRGVPNMREQSSDRSEDSDSDCDLPTQNVVNLFGDTAGELNFNQLSHRPIHTHPPARRSSVQPPRSSDGKPMVPNGTPVSGRPTTKTSTSKEMPPRLRNIEVQEVFDLTDLQSNWDDTFLPKKCYVWISKERQTAEREENKENIQTHRLKDMTEDLVPREVEMQRHRENMKKYHPGRRSPSTFFHPPALTYLMSRQGYHGLHELLDLPRDVLVALMNHIPERDMLDPDRFAQALLRTLPKLEKQNNCVSLAYGNVIYQTKKPILDGKRRFAKTEYELPSGQQIFKMDSNFWEQFVHANNLDKQAVPQILASQSVRELGSPSFSRKAPLPNISPTGDAAVQKDDSSETQEEEAPLGGKLMTNKKLPPSINIGLPALPSHMRPTKPFHYKNASNVTFSLEPRDPSVLMQRIDLSPVGSRKTGDEADERPCSASTERSSLRVTMPLIPRESEGDVHKILQAEGEPKMTTKRSSTLPITDIHSAKIPHPPPTTPLNVYSPRTTPALSSATAKEHNGILAPIREHGDQALVKGQEIVPKSRSGRSVRFAAKVDEAFVGNEHLDSVSGRSISPSQASAMAASSDGHSEQPLGEEMGSVHGRQGTPWSEGTPEPKWPQVDEDAIREATMTPREESVKSHDLSATDMTSSANKYRRLWAERTEASQSPGPPPPSPEPHQIQYPSTMMAARGKSPLSMLPKDLTRTDSTFTISAKPPSTLDDTSRIHTPASYDSKPLMSRDNTQHDLPTVKEAYNLINQQHVSVPPDGTSNGSATTKEGKTNLPNTGHDMTKSEESSTNAVGKVNDNPKSNENSNDGRGNNESNNTSKHQDASAEAVTKKETVSDDKTSHKSSEDVSNNGQANGNNIAIDIIGKDERQVKVDGDECDDEVLKEKEVINASAADEDAAVMDAAAVATDAQNVTKADDTSGLMSGDSVVSETSLVNTPNNPTVKPDTCEASSALDHALDDQELTKAVGLLDQFDSTEVQLVEDLKKELEKLDQ